MSSLVEILLSTYNGAKYLEVQLDSICNQNYADWKLLIRDDGSTDETITILNRYTQKYPGKILLLNDNEGNVGYSKSFLKLLMQSSANYVMYCDQDDYWMPDKISTMLSVILEEESELSAAGHLVFSDLQLTDSKLNITSPSFFKKIGYSSKMQMQIFFLKNYVPGCNLLFNRNLIQQALKTNNIINLHDHWLMMVCSAVGKITCINKPLMKYRLHNNNAIGFMEKHTPPTQSLLAFFKDILKFGLSNKNYRHLLYEKNILQFQSICEGLHEIVSKDAISFAKIDKTNYISRKIKNIYRPYVLERTLLKQLTYIICF